MDKKKLSVIVASIVFILVVILIISAILRKIDNDRKDYDAPLTFEYNYYKVYINGKYGVLNKKGELIVQPNYDDIVIPNPEKAVFICQYNYNNEIDKYDCIVLNDKTEQLFKNYNNIEPISVTGIIGNIPYEKFVLKYKKDDKYGIVGINGNKITDAIYEEVSSVPYKEGVILIKENGKYGVINNKGVILIKPEYDSIIGDGYYDSKTGYKASGFIVRKGEYSGYIAEMGEVILNNEYDSVYRIASLPERYMIVRKNGQYGFLNGTKIIIGFNYQELIYDENTNLLKAKRGRNYGVINKEGNKVLPIEFSNIVLSGIYITATRNDAIEKYTLDGQPVTNDLYTTVYKTSGDYFVSIDKNYNYGILDKDMNVIINNKYEYLDYISDKLIIVRNEDGKYGIIDLKEKNKVNFEYDVMQVIKNTNIVQGLVLNTKTLHLFNSNVEKIYSGDNAEIYSYNEYIKVVNKNDVIYFNANGVETSNSVVYPDNKILAYNSNGKWGFKNRAGAVVLNANYDTVTEVNKNGFAGINKDGKWGIIDENGKIIVEPTYKISDGTEPEFLGIYYKAYSGYVDGYYTK